MKQKVADLYRRFRKVKSMTGFATVKIYYVNSVPDSCTKLEISGEPYLRLPTRYDNGSDEAAVAQILDDGMVLSTRCCIH